LVLMALITLSVGLILTSGFAAFMVGHLNMISIAFALLFIGLSNDYSIHILLRLRESMRKYTTQTAIFSSLSAVAPSLLLCAVSTTIGFFAFLPTAFHGVSELGLIAGTGILISFVLHFTFLPALLTLFPPKNTYTTRDSTWNKITELPFVYRKTILFTFFALCIGSLFLIKNLQFNADPMQLRDPTQPSVITFLELDKKLDKSLLSITYLANDFQELGEIKENILKLPSVKEVMTIHDFIPDNQKKKIAEIAAIRELFHSIKITKTSPETLVSRIASLKALITLLSPYAHYSIVKDFRVNAQDFIERTGKLPLFEQVRTWDNLSYKLLRGLEYHRSQMQQGLLGEPFIVEDLPAELLSRWKQNATYRIEIFPKESMENIKNQQTFVHEVLSVVPHATGLPVIHEKAGETVVTAFVEAFLTAFIMILLLLILLMQNLKQIILTLIPLLAACLITIAVAVVFNVDFNFANVIALPLLLGIGIDNGIHLVHRYYSDWEHKTSLLASSTAKAVIVSTLTTIFSFMNLAFSPHQGMASLGIILTVGMIAASLSTLLFLPALLKTWNGK
ncbi:MAG TPA: MMPL family transporter, partial [Gammaproteobacteria bacterium]|nr:MMPL family transporter [Gammaproteobacteria bacterium]